MTTNAETIAPTIDATTTEPTQYEFPEGWTFPSFDPNGTESEGTRVVYVNRVRAGNRDAWVGTFRHAEAGRGNDGWTSNGRRVYGAVVNPEPRNGRHYLVFGRFVVRYNDEFHDYARHHSAHPYSIISAADGTPWFFPNDSLVSLEGSDYITISNDVVSNLGQQIATAEPVTPELWEDGRETITFGYARQEEDGTVLLNPVPVPGDVYIMWDSAVQDSSDNHRAYVAVYEGGGAVHEAFSPSGHWYRYYNNAEFTNVSTFETNPDRWVKLGTASDYAEPTNTYVTMYESATAKAKREFEAFNAATNKLAMQHSWCSTYESIIKPLGMKSRYHGYWSVEVQAKLCITRESMDGYPARDILSNLGISGREIANLSLEAKVTFSVPGVQAETEQEAKELVTPEMMAEALTSRHPDMNFSEMTETEIIGVSEDRDAAINAVMNTPADDE